MLLSRTSGLGQYLMRLLKLAFRRETAMPMLALTFASGVCLILISARIIWTGKLRYGFLLWNLFLAWLPLLFPLLACEKYHNASGRNWRFLGLAGAWLLFFPNAPYIFTDLIHLTRGYFPHFWVDMVLILTCALTVLAHSPEATAGASVAGPAQRAGAALSVFA